MSFAKTLTYFRATYDGERGESIGESIVQSNAEKYRMYERFKFKCVSCNTENVIVKPFNKIDGKLVPVLERCANKECTWAPAIQLDNIRNQLSLAIRKAIRTYYDNWMICDDPNCNQSTRTYVHVSFTLWSYASFGVVPFSDVFSYIYL